MKYPRTNWEKPVSRGLPQQRSTDTVLNTVAQSLQYGTTTPPFGTMRLEEVLTVPLWLEAQLAQQNSPARPQGSSVSFVPAVTLSSTMFNTPRPVVEGAGNQNFVPAGTAGQPSLASVYDGLTATTGRVLAARRPTMDNVFDELPTAPPPVVVNRFGDDDANGRPSIAPVPAVPVVPITTTTTQRPTTTTVRQTRPATRQTTTRNTQRTTTRFITRVPQTPPPTRPPTTTTTTRTSTILQQRPLFPQQPQPSPAQQQPILPQAPPPQTYPTIVYERPQAPPRVSLPPPPPPPQTYPTIVYERPQAPPRASPPPPPPPQTYPTIVYERPQAPPRASPPPPPPPQTYPTIVYERPQAPPRASPPPPPQALPPTAPARPFYVPPEPPRTPPTQDGVQTTPDSIIDHFFVPPSQAANPSLQPSPIVGLWNQLGTKIADTADAIAGMLKKTVDVLVTSHIQSHQRALRRI
uniref:Uncharacterized protein n=1 Tax=Anopheles culicifacies TaxID=139723 RepID=A0A182M3U8_9DIPT